MRRMIVLALVAGCRINFDAVGDGGVGDDTIDAPPAIGRWRSVAVSNTNGCGIALDGTGYCWGYNQGGNVGNGVPSSYADVTQLSGTAWETIAVANSHTCGLRNGGELWCWGFNQFFALGRPPDGGIFADPVRIETDTWSALAAATGRTCGIKSDATLWCWGAGFEGQLGVGDTTVRQNPTQIGAASWRSITMGDEVTCGIQTNGSIWCWGFNGDGVTGIGSTVPALVLTPTLVDGGPWTTVTTYGEHVCATNGADGARCWGVNFAGQLGTLDTTNSATPMPVLATSGIRTIATSSFATCALVEPNGHLWCWGNSFHGMLGDVQDHVQAVDMGVDGASLALGGGTACYIDVEARLWCIGGNGSGQGGPPQGAAVVIRQADTITDWAAIYGADSNACGAHVSGDIDCWGSNRHARNGDGTYDTHQHPMATGHVFDRLVMGVNTTFGHRGADEIWVWGYNRRTGSDVASPAHSFPDAVDVSGGDDHTCSISPTGVLTCGGNNDYGQIGNGTNTPTADAVIGASPWAAISASSDYATCGIHGATGARRVECWGRNDIGQLGLGGVGDRNVPQAVVGMPALDATAISAGFRYACAIVTPGTLWCWGVNGSGQLGVGDASNRVTAAQVGTRSDWTKVVTGDFHTCARAADATLWCWGHGDEGQVGPALVDRSTPTQVPGSWIDVAVGAHWTCGIKTDRTRWCMGNNEDGQLGDGLSWRETFTQIP